MKDHPKTVDELRGRLNATHIRTGSRMCIEFQDTKKPDNLGRRHFALLWIDDDGLPGARIRGQHFFAKADDHVRIDIVGGRR